MNQRFVEITTEGSFETVSALRAFITPIAIPYAFTAGLTIRSQTGCTRNTTPNARCCAQRQRVLRQGPGTVTRAITHLTCHFLAFEHFARSLVLTDRTRTGEIAGVTVSSVPGTEVPALNGTSETFTLEVPGYVNFLTSANSSTLTTHSSFAFSQTEFTATSRPASTPALAATRFRLGDG